MFSIVIQFPDIYQKFVPEVILSYFWNEESDGGYFSELFEVDVLMIGIWSNLFNGKGVIDFSNIL